MNENKENQGIFINGKQQMIDMLKHMDVKERRKLISNLANRNSSMARELSEQSVSYKDLEFIEDSKLKIILDHSNPSIVGLALHISSSEFQRRCLKLMIRSNAEKAFQIMNYDLNGKLSECKKAQHKILTTAVELIKNKMFTL